MHQFARRVVKSLLRKMSRGCERCQRWCCRWQDALCECVRPAAPERDVQIYVAGGSTASSQFNGAFGRGEGEVLPPLVLPAAEGTSGAGAGPRAGSCQDKECRRRIERLEIKYAEMQIALDTLVKSLSAADPHPNDGTPGITLAEVQLRQIDTAATPGITLSEVQTSQMDRAALEDELTLNDTSKVQDVSTTLTALQKEDEENCI